MDDVQLVLVCISTLAAVGAVWLARQTVRETRAMRREDRLVQLPELVEQAGDAMLEIVTHTGRGQWNFPVRTSRLRAALAPLDDPLPACRTLASGGVPEGVDSADPVRAMTTAALAEVADVLRAHRHD